MVDNLVRGEIARDLGIPPYTNVHATLYKLLLYETGGFFKPHRDTEKENGMFGTLVIMLPSAYQGGSLIVKHKYTTKVFDFAAHSEFGAFYTAFYCDCKHQIKPVTSGYRLCLVYNLCAANSAALRAKDNEEQLEVGRTLFKYFANNHSLFTYVLDHQYSLAGLTMASFKGADLAVVQLLLELAGELKLGMAFAQIEVQDYEQGTYESDDYCDLEEEDIDRTVKVLEWIDLNGQVLPKASNIELELSEIVPEGWYRNISPYNEEQEDTGNEGTTVERWFRQAAILIWPHDNPPVTHLKRKVAAVQPQTKKISMDKIIILYFYFSYCR
ncbi:hypothetical protein HK102_006581 [Quaeritorhiza haematococci]|nr:hypothetical protein HK102_006581 [Quaeritorhiza haematococci]